ncbi:transposase [Thalassospira alkalitolerans]|uniref:transposase n=1 Tax=Thalassospira alkalitolerans TaxID=1293890 RepID=UPI003AA800EF
MSDGLMQPEREQYLKVNRYERTPDQQGYTNGYKPKRIDTPRGPSRFRCPRPRAMERVNFTPIP